MHTRVVQHHDGHLPDGERQALELLDDELTRDATARRLEHQVVGPRQQSEAVQARALSRRHEDPLACELPAVRHARLQRVAALVAVVEVNQPRLRELFQLPEALYFQRVDFRARLLGGTASDPFIASTMFFIYRWSVFVLKVLPSPASNSAFAKLIRWRLAATAALTRGKSCSASSTGFRPLPG